MWIDLNNANIKDLDYEDLNYNNKEKINNRKNKLKEYGYC